MVLLTGIAAAHQSWLCKLVMNIRTGHRTGVLEPDVSEKAMKVQLTHAQGPSSPVSQASQDLQAVVTVILTDKQLIFET